MTLRTVRATLSPFALFCGKKVTAFIERWEHSGAAERANYVLFLSELCALLDLPRPDPASPDNAQNTYVFERAVTRKNPDGTTSTGFIDLYRRGSFVLESKQGKAKRFGFITTNSIHQTFNRRVLEPFPGREPFSERSGA